jgi:hypothetical protein
MKLLKQLLRLGNSGLFCHLCSKNLNIPCCLAGDHKGRPYGSLKQAQGYSGILFMFEQPVFAF